MTNTVVIPPGTADALDALCAEHPALAPTIERLMVAAHLFARDFDGPIKSEWVLVNTPPYKGMSCTKSARAPSVHALARAIGADPWHLALALLAVGDARCSPGAYPNIYGAVNMRILPWWRNRRTVSFELSPHESYRGREADLGAKRWGVWWPRARQ